MAEDRLKLARQLMNEGLYYDNLQRMAQCCKGETTPERLVSSYVLYHAFSELAKEIGDKPVVMSQMRKLEAKFRTTLNLCLEKAISGANTEDQQKYLTQLIGCLWDVKTPS